MNSTENETCIFNDVADLDKYIPPAFLSVVLLALPISAFCFYLRFKERSEFSGNVSNITWQTTNSFLILIIVVLTLIPIFAIESEENYFKNEFIKDGLMMIAWMFLAFLILCLKIFDNSRLSSTKCNVLHMFLLIIFTIPFVRDIYLLAYWYTRCISKEQRLSYGICLHIRLAITFALCLIQLKYTRRRSPMEIRKHQREVKVLIPLTSGATSKFFNALQHRLTKNGIRLQRIDKEDVNHAEQVIAICICCTRIDSDIKQISGLDSSLQQNISVLIIVYLVKEQYKRDNIRTVKGKCQNIEHVVEMFFTSELENEGIKDTPENREALGTILNAV